MSSRDPRVDVYIAHSATFAQPILKHLRALVHANCGGIEETIKWGFPHFMYAGSILCSMAAFKEHAALGFWKAGLIDGIDTIEKSAGMGQFGRLQSVNDLPDKRVLAGMIRQVMELNSQGSKRPKATRAPRGRAVSMPVELATALATNTKARETYERLAPSAQRETMEWIAEAKHAATRNRRSLQAIAGLCEDKARNGKNLSSLP